MEEMTVDELIHQLVELSKQGYGDTEVTANMEYKVWGVGLDTIHNVVDIDCHL